MATEDVDKLAKDPESTLPLEIMVDAHGKFGNDIAIAFSGAENVALIEYAWFTVHPFRVFSLDSGRQSLEAHRFFDAIEKHHGMCIECKLLHAVEVQTIVRNSGLFSFNEDCPPECCQINKARPLKWAPRVLQAWITGQRKGQCPGTRAGIAVVQTDTSFEGVDCELECNIPRIR